jgi:hypothetical protein
MGKVHLLTAPSREHPAFRARPVVPMSLFKRGIPILACASQFKQAFCPPQYILCKHLLTMDG